MDDPEKKTVPVELIRQARADIYSHPDFITVDDPEKKTVPVELIRQARADIYIQPNESEHKIYLFPRAQDMGIPGQNALLKVLEEPPKYGVFLLLTDNPDKILPTVRSRCTELAMQALPPEVLKAQLRKDFPQAQPEDIAAAMGRSGGFLGQARQLLEQEGQDPQTELFAQALARRDALALLKVLEEPPKYGVFLLLTDNPDKILPTVRSRCTELAMQALPPEVLKAQLRKDFPQAQPEDIAAAMGRSGGFLGQARQLLEQEGQDPQTELFAQALARRDALALLQVLVPMEKWKVPMEKWKRDALAQTLTQWLQLVEAALVSRSGVQAISPQARQLAQVCPVQQLYNAVQCLKKALTQWLQLVEAALVSRSGVQAISPQARQLAQVCPVQQLYNAVQCLKKALDYTQRNVSPAAVCGWLEWELR